jgi:Zn-dependent membrane protease YugP
MFLDPLYFIVLGIGIVLSLAATRYTKKKFSDASQIRLKSNLTGFQIANKMLIQENFKDIVIVENSNILSDHYDPCTKTLVFSSQVYRGVNVATAAVVAHEMGHVLQHVNNYIPLMVRSRITSMAKIGGIIGTLLIIVGTILEISIGLQPYLTLLGLAFMIIAYVFILITIPIEFNASAQAKDLLSKSNILQSNQEKKALTEALLAASLSYIPPILNPFIKFIKTNKS